MRLVAFLAALFAVFAGRAFAAPEAFHRTDPASTTVVDHGAWSAFLATYLVPGADGSANLVRYGSVSAADRASLKAYIDALETVSPTRLNRDEAFVYWVNLYNALTVDVILDHYPVKSIREIKSGLVSLGPWGRKLVTIDGEALTLNDVEHGILRAHFKDPRVHFAVNCASIGCPDLKGEAWTAATLGADLDAAARAKFANWKRSESVPGGLTYADYADHLDDVALASENGETLVYRFAAAGAKSGDAETRLVFDRRTGGLVGYRVAALAPIRPDPATRLETFVFEQTFARVVDDAPPLMTHVRWRAAGTRAFRRVDEDYEIDFSDFARP